MQHKCVLYTITVWHWFLPKRPRVNKHEYFSDEFFVCPKTLSEYGNLTTKRLLALLSDLMRSEHVGANLQCGSTSMNRKHNKGNYYYIGGFLIR